MRLPLQNTFARGWLVAAVALATISCASAVPPHRPATGPTTAGQLPDQLHEASGLAISRRTGDLLWAHNDHGSKPLLYAMDSAGTLRGVVRINGASSTDWEDLASFELDGEPWLLIADTGDNSARRRNVTLYLVAEPEAAELNADIELPVRAAMRITVRFPDGPQDCEAVAVDPVRREVLLITKRSSPPKVYRVPLPAIDRKSITVTAEEIAMVGTIPPATLVQRFSFGADGMLRAWPTGLDISADGLTAVVLTYGEPWIFRRAADETWFDAFQRQPQRLQPHKLPQAEAVAFDRESNALWIASEGRGEPLVRYEFQ